MIIKGSDLDYRDLLPGDVIRVIYGKSHPGNRTYHAAVSAKQIKVTREDLNHERNRSLRPR